MNSTIIVWFEKILKDYESDTKKTIHQKKAIHKAIYELKKYDKEIKTDKDILEFQKK